jgi:hypothetical protein
MNVNGTVAVVTVGASGVGLALCTVRWAQLEQLGELLSAGVLVRPSSSSRRNRSWTGYS